MRRSVLIASASRGIALANAKVYQATGDRIAPTYHTMSAPDGFLSVPSDITQPADIGTTFATIAEQHGPVEVLVPNAGSTRDKLLLTMSEDDFTSVLDTNLTNAYRVAKLAARRMIRLREGRILFISSTSTLYGQVGPSGYTASKTRLIGFARFLAHELAPLGITVNPLSRSPTIAAILNALGAEEIEGLAAQVPLGQPARPDEIARAALFLTSSEAAYLTGQILAVGGGAPMGH
ncbi:SDR family oxidoreductase [Kitasatospora sp. NPDC091257]|uniref:SDR family oxidoreductase n=1 Tax=Kitasatospora sp. NPDC091257 TaxID=3364084 RepID=UPI0037F1EB6C